MASYLPANLAEEGKVARFVMSSTREKTMTIMVGLEKVGIRAIIGTTIRSGLEMQTKMTISTEGPVAVDMVTISGDAMIAIDKLI